MNTIKLNVPARFLKDITNSVSYIQEFKDSCEVFTFTIASSAAKRIENVFHVHIKHSVSYPIGHIHEMMLGKRTPDIGLILLMICKGDFAEIDTNKHVATVIKHRFYGLQSVDELPYAASIEVQLNRVFGHSSRLQKPTVLSPVSIALDPKDSQLMKIHFAAESLPARTSLNTTITDDTLTVAFARPIICGLLSPHVETMMFLGSIEGNYPGMLKEHGITPDTWVDFFRDVDNHDRIVNLRTALIESQSELNQKKTDSVKTHTTSQSIKEEQTMNNKLLTRNYVTETIEMLRRLPSTFIDSLNSKPGDNVWNFTIGADIANVLCERGYWESHGVGTCMLNATDVKRSVDAYLQGVGIGSDVVPMILFVAFKMREIPVDKCLDSGADLVKSKVAPTTKQAHIISPDERGLIKEIYQADYHPAAHPEGVMISLSEKVAHSLNQLCGIKKFINGAMRLSSGELQRLVQDDGVTLKHRLAIFAVVDAVTTKSRRTSHEVACRLALKDEFTNWAMAVIVQNDKLAKRLQANCGQFGTAHNQQFGFNGGAGYGHGTYQHNATHAAEHIKSVTTKIEVTPEGGDMFTPGTMVALTLKPGTHIEFPNLCGALQPLTITPISINSGESTVVNVMIGHMAQDHMAINAFVEMLVEKETRSIEDLISVVAAILGHSLAPQPSQTLVEEVSRAIRGMGVGIPVPATAHDLLTALTTALGNKARATTGQYDPRRAFVW